MANPSQEAHETVEFFDHISIKHKCVNLYDCPDCSVGFLWETGLKIHISTVHENNVGNICPICGRILKTGAVLKDHISNMHEGKSHQDSTEKWQNHVLFERFYVE